MLPPEHAYFYMAAVKDNRAESIKKNLMEVNVLSDINQSDINRSDQLIFF